MRNIVLKSYVVALSLIGYLCQVIIQRPADLWLTISYKDYFGYPTNHFDVLIALVFVIPGMGMGILALGLVKIRYNQHKADRQVDDNNLKTSINQGNYSKSINYV